MKTKSLTGILCCILTLLISLSIVPARASCHEYTVGEVQSLIDGIASYKLNESGSGNIQDWINGSLTSGAGTLSEWYIIALSQDGQRDFSSYEKALRNYLDTQNVPNATSRQKYALALIAAGSGSPYISDILDGSLGQQGIMSWIYGLHILNNGYTCSVCNTDQAVAQILSMQYPDGGWAIFGDYGDIDVTAMVIQALAPHYPYHQDVHDSVERGLDFLSQRQKDNGGYESFGTPNPESTAQVLAAVSALGIDCQKDSRFIKNDNTLIDGITAYRLPDGSFCHMAGGGFNETATTQAFYSLIAYKRMTEGKQSLYLFDNRQPQEAPAPETTTQAAAPVQTTRQGSSGGGAVTTAPAKNAAGTQSTTVTSTAVSSGVTSSSASEKASGLSVSTTVISSSAEGVSTTVLLSMYLDTETSVTTAPTEKIMADPGKPGGYKPVAVIIMISLGAAVSLVLFAAKKRNIRNFIFVAVITAAGVCVLLFTDIRTKDDYYNGSQKEKSSAVGTVTLEIRCDTIAGKTDKNYIPEDGVILAPTEFDIEEGDTVYDILTEAARSYNIQIDNKGSSGSAHGLVYIAGINYIYEFDYGDLSGWVYHVNGITPSRNCGEYVLSDGDEVQWLYTCELGHDLNEIYESDIISGEVTSQ